MSRKPAICLQYNIKTPRDVFYYKEYFTPYFVNDIKESPYFKKYSEKFNSLFDDSKEISLDFLPREFWDNVDDEQILPDTANILMDTIYCVSASLWGTDELFLNFNPYYIGLYTELVKRQIDEVKSLISLLIYLQNASDDRNNPEINLFFEEIKKNFIFNHPGTFYDSKQSSTITGCLCCLCSYKNIQPPARSFSIEIDLLNFDRFLSLLRNYKPDSGNARFYDGKNCFCLAIEGRERFFALSGFDETYDKLGNKIKNDLESYFKNVVFNFCKFDANATLSYGYKDSNGVWQNLNPPAEFNNNSSLKIENASNQYKCCERKIFPYTKKYNKNLDIYCKYMPCCRCVPAVKEQIRMRPSFHFFALSRDSDHFRHLLKKRKRLLLRESGIFTLYP